jgi:hypothetical protein
MGILDNLTVYQCGQVENDDDPAGWRNASARSLYKINPLLRICDPLSKPQWLDPKGKDDKIAYGLKNYIGHKDHASEAIECLDANVYIRRICKQLASKCDIFIARITKTFTWGSIDELEIAITRNIPIFLVLPDGLISIYGMSGILTDYSFYNDYIHADMDSLTETIGKIDSGESDLINKDPEKWMRLTWPHSGELQ